MKSFGLTDKGAVREENQDSFIIEKCDAAGCVIAAICDGMGGAKAGGLASKISNKAFVSYAYEKLCSCGRKKPNYPQILRNACRRANGVSYEYAMFDESCSGMGTTIVGGVIKNNGKAYIINVGDSRAYLIGLKGGTITQITKDHSYVQTLVDSGAISKEEAKTHPCKNLITRVLGTEAAVEADLFEISIEADQVLLMCSDGLTNTLEEDEILESAQEDSDPEALCRLLMSMALNRGARDNVTVIAVIK